MISVLIPVFDKRVYPYLELTLSSIISQSVKCDEIIILNDGLDNNGSKEIAKRFSCKYMFTGQRNTSEKTYWRGADWAFNIGLKRCLGDIILCQEPEVFLLDPYQIEKMLNNLGDKKAVHPSKIYIDTGILINKLQNNEIPDKSILSQIQNNYHSWFWYSLLINKKDLMEVNGWEETMYGECYNDGLWYDILVNSGVKFFPVDSEAIHMFHPRVNTPHWQYNKDLYEKLRVNSKNNLNNPNWGQNIWKNFWNL